MVVLETLLFVHLITRVYVVDRLWDERFGMPPERLLQLVIRSPACREKLLLEVLFEILLELWWVLLLVRRKRL